MKVFFSVEYAPLNLLIQLDPMMVFWSFWEKKVSSLLFRLERLGHLN